MNETTVSHIKWHVAIGVSCLLLAKYFKASLQQIDKIINGITWKHVKAVENAAPLIFSKDRGLPIRLRGQRLKTAFADRLKKDSAWTELARGLESL